MDEFVAVKSHDTTEQQPRTGMNRVRSSIEVGSDDEDHRGRDDRGGDGGGEGGGGAHPFQAAPGYRDAVHWHNTYIPWPFLGQFSALF